MSVAILSPSPSPFVATAFNTELFNALPHIDKLRHDEETQLRRYAFVQTAKELVKQHALMSAVGITLTHKHLDIEQNEIILGSYDEAENKIATTWCTPDEETQRPFLFPFQFVFHLKKGWVPVAYWDVRAPGGLEMKDKVERLLNATAFLEEFASHLVSFQHADDSSEFAPFGLTAIFHTLVKGYGDRGLGLVETTNLSMRNQLFGIPNDEVLNDPANCVVDTIWHWKESADKSKEYECASACIVDRWSHDHN